MKKNRIFLGWMVCWVLFSAGCGGSPETIKDIRQLRQDLLSYLDPVTADRPLLSPEEQQRLDAAYNERFFSPWHRDRSRFAAEEILWGFQEYRKNLGYGENRRRHTAQWIRDLHRNGNPEAYPNAARRAITVEHTDLRVLPTMKPHFDSPDLAGSGYPFDNLQNSSVPPNTPIFISHVSRDKAWVLAETHYACGWVRSRDVADVDEELIRSWEQGPWVAVIRDKISLTDDAGVYRFKAALGTLFPLLADTADRWEVAIAAADLQRRAVRQRAFLSREQAVRKPLPLTARQIALLGNELLHEPYGWGGLYGNRDCSAMIRDLFAPFGLWLPRNSAEQAREGGNFISLEGLSPIEKEKRILTDGVPFLTLLWRRGHIMLYIGQEEGNVLVFHNLWGIRTHTLMGRESRKIVGHAAVTTLHPGTELWNIDLSRGDLLSGLLGMTLLGAAPVDAVFGPRALETFPFPPRKDRIGKRKLFS